MSEAGLVWLRCYSFPIQRNIRATIHHCACNDFGDGLGLLWPLPSSRLSVSNHYVCDGQTPTLDRGPTDRQQVVDREQLPASLQQRGVNSPGHACAQPAVHRLVHGNFPDSSWLASRVLVEGKLGPVPLLPFNQFLGYDDTTRPGASARVEQMLSRMFQTACVLFTFFWGGSMFQTCVGQSDAC